MRVARFEDVEFASAFGIEMAGISRLIGGDAGVSPVAASFGRIAPGGETTAHRHDETEAFVILSGSGEIVGNNGVRHPFDAGNVLFFDPFDAHILRNTGDAEVRFVDLYWRDSAAAAAAAGRCVAPPAPVFVFSTPPTPNGDLHLGHLSGPYLGGDVMLRFLRLQGEEGWHLTGSDDYQHSIVEQALKESRSEQEIACHYTAEIRTTLALMDIEIDQFTSPLEDPSYAEGLRAFFSRLVASGAVRRVRGPALFGERSGEYLYDVAVTGGCPACPGSAGGGVCEECGAPNDCVDLARPRSVRAEAGAPGEADRFSLRLADHADAVFDLHRRNRSPARLQALAARTLARTELDLALTHPSRWGVAPAEPCDGDQVIWVWAEMAWSLLYGIEALGKRLGRDWRADAPEDNWRVLAFFGYDNSFFHTVLFPILFKLAHPDWRPQLDWHLNEFYLLDGAKFSTSRRHAIWGKQVLSPDTVDAVRWYLARTRGETERTNFELAACAEAASAELIDRWQGWLNALGERVACGFAGQAPEPGNWTPEHRAFLATLQARLASMHATYSADGLSLNRAARELGTLVADARHFAASQQSLEQLDHARAEYRTAVALELAAARLLAQCATPLMPRFARRLAAALGLAPADRWVDHVELTPTGARIALAGVCFFVVPTLLDLVDNNLDQPENLSAHGRIA